MEVVLVLQCDCEERIGVKINSVNQFGELKQYFNDQVKNGTFSDILVEKPYYEWSDWNGREVQWYADKWYKCNVCNIMLEFVYPDFPAKGFVKKYDMEWFY